MAELIFFGTCSGTEPQPNTRHCAFAIKANGGYYWFDAGEGCSHTAHVLGVDLLRVRSIFITHIHMDHIGGLGNLLWNIRKLTTRTGRNPEGDKVRVFFPDLECFDALLKVLSYTEGGFKCNFQIQPTQTADGEVFADDGIRVVAHHNLHLPQKANGAFASYSYKIEAEGKTVVYSGDVRSIEELDFLLGAGSDYLIMETGHHKVEEVCRYAKAKGVKTLLFTHHGREILGDREGAQSLASSIMTDARICEDGTRITL